MELTKQNKTNWQRQAFFFFHQKHYKYAYRIFLLFTVSSQLRRSKSENGNENGKMGNRERAREGKKAYTCSDQCMGAPINEKEIQQQQQQKGFLY